MSMPKHEALRIVYDRGGHGGYEVQEYSAMDRWDGWRTISHVCATLREAEIFVSLTLTRRAERELRKRPGTVVKVIEP